MALLSRLMPPALTTSPAERLRAGTGAFLGILVTALASTLWLGTGAGPLLLIAPMGASAVLLFGVPASPLAQPWAIIGGNLVAALIGVTAARWIGSPLLAASVAAGGTMLATSLLRCVHPPSGAVALTAVLGGPHVVALGYGFALVPVGLNSALLLAVALVYNNATRRSYPHHAHPPAHPHPAKVPLGIGADDIDAVLADYGEPLDISREDLGMLLRELLGRIEQRNAER
jgi:CBS domain-containing membrane protein